MPTRAPPHVSVVITAYGELRFLEDAVASILGQSYRDFEIIIVDDATPTPDVFDRLAILDQRIRIIHNADNLGAASSANRGIAVSRGAIVARIDADDIADPARLERLVAAFEADPRLGLLGSWYIRIDVENRELESMRPPTSDWGLRWRLLFHNPFCHSAMAFRRSVFELSGRYNESMRASLDADLWYRMAQHCQIACLPEFLARYRVNPAGISAANPPDWHARTDAHRVRLWRTLGIPYPAEIVRDLTQFVCGWDVSRTELRPQVYRTILQILPRFCRFQGVPNHSDGSRDRRNVIATMIARALADPATDFANWSRLFRMAWHITPWTTARAAADRAGALLKDGRDIALRYVAARLRARHGAR